METESISTASDYPREPRVGVIATETRNRLNKEAIPFSLKIYLACETIRMLPFVLSYFLACIPQPTNTLTLKELNLAQLADVSDGSLLFSTAERCYPVDIFYTKDPVSNYKNANELTRAVLADLVDEIQASQKMLQDSIERFGLKDGEMCILPRDANVSPDMQSMNSERMPRNTQTEAWPMLTNIAKAELPLQNNMPLSTRIRLRPEDFSAGKGNTEIGKEQLPLQENINSRTDLVMWLETIISKLETVIRVVVKQIELLLLLLWVLVAQVLLNFMAIYVGYHIHKPIIVHRIRRIRLKARRKITKSHKKSCPFKKDLMAAILKKQIIFAQREPGSDKTYQIPQYLHEAGLTKNGKKIGCTLPNDANVMSAAACVAKEMEVELGKEVGYSIPFMDCTSESTAIKYMTAEMLLHELQSDSNLDSYSVIMSDIQEPTATTFMLLGLLSRIARRRPDFKLIISASKIDADKFRKKFGEAAIFRIPGSRYPVDVLYQQEPVLNYIDATVDLVLDIHKTTPSGDILVFLADETEIEVCQEMLQDCVKLSSLEDRQLLILPFYAHLSSDMLEKIFEPTSSNKRKVVLTTNIAETLSTIDNIVYVIDSGYEEQKNIHPPTGLEMLMNVPISKASANLRACLASVVAPGKCFRLYTADDYENLLEEHTVPEIKRINLSNAVLTLKALGIENLLHFDFLDPPPQETLVFALGQLYALGALNHRGELTRTGRCMAQFPVNPMMAKMLLASEKYNCSEEIATIAAMLLVNGAVFFRHKDTITDADKARKNFNHLDGDHLSLMQVYNQWAASGYSEQWCSENYIQYDSMKRARDIREKLVGLIQKVGINMVSSLPYTTNIRKAIIAGFFYHVTRHSEGANYQTVKHNQTLVMQHNSALFSQLPRLVLYHELLCTTKKYMRFVMAIDDKELLEVALHYYKLEELEDIPNENIP